MSYLYILNKFILLGSEPSELDKQVVQLPTSKLLRQFWKRNVLKMLQTPNLLKLLTCFSQFIKCVLMTFCNKHSKRCPNPILPNPKYTNYISKYSKFYVQENERLNPNTPTAGWLQEHCGASTLPHWLAGLAGTFRQLRSNQWWANCKTFRQ